MKKTKRILAAAGAVLLLALYGSTLIFALLDIEGSENLLMAAVASTIILPVLLYAYTLVYRVMQNKADADMDDTDTEKEKEDR